MVIVLTYANVYMYVNMIVFEIHAGSESLLIVVALVCNYINVMK